MKESLSFDDVLLSPRFSNIKSRKDVKISTTVATRFLPLPIISSNMDTVTNEVMARTMSQHGGVGCLHRFQSVEDNIRQYINSQSYPWVSVGLGSAELERAEALYSVGANVFVLDVAHGASMEVVKQTKELKKLLHPSAKIIVGNFANAESIKSFIWNLGSSVDAYKVGIGGGSACLTRVVTGVGGATFGSILDCASLGVDIIADGGIRNSGDFAKAIAAGAKAVMIGGLLAGTDEAPGEAVYERQSYEDRWGQLKQENVLVGKKYRGSASLESYEVQGKVAQHRAPEGDAFLVPYTGPVANVLQSLEAGLRSSMSYVGAETIVDFQELAEFVRITSGGLKENSSHGKKGL